MLAVRASETKKTKECNMEAAPGVLLDVLPDPSVSIHF